MKQQKALELFNSGLNCAQSVFVAYAEDLHLDPNVAASVSCGFGGGMGRMQKTCGAVTGSFMTLSVYNSQKYVDIKELKSKTYAMIQLFHSKFLAIHGTSKCRKLINCDLSTPKGQEYAQKNNVHATICEKCIIDSTNILDELMSE